MRSGIFLSPLLKVRGEGDTKIRLFDNQKEGYAVTQHTYKRLVTQVANVFATYKVDPHDEGAPVQDVVDHLTRCVAHLLPQEDQAWFVTASRLQEPLWRYEGPVD